MKGGHFDGVQAVSCWHDFVTVQHQTAEEERHFKSRPIMSSFILWETIIIKNIYPKRDKEKVKKHKKQSSWNGKC